MAIFSKTFIKNHNLSVFICGEIVIFKALS